MPRPPFEPFTSPHVVLRVDDIDTDQIIPARFLTSTQRSSWGELAFHDWRYKADGTPNPDFVLNQPGAVEAMILVAGRNFGCGSSREHAVWALMGASIRCVISMILQAQLVHDSDHAITALEALSVVRHHDVVLMVAGIEESADVRRAAQTLTAKGD